MNQDEERAVLEIASQYGSLGTGKEFLLAFAAAIEAELLKDKVLVPREPTDAMRIAMHETICAAQGWSAGRVYEAMIQATPSAGKETT